MGDSDRIDRFTDQYDMKKPMTGQKPQAVYDPQEPGTLYCETCGQPLPEKEAVEAEIAPPDPSIEYPMAPQGSAAEPMKRPGVPAKPMPGYGG